MEADGVFSGGGVKGIAFAGAIAAAEEAGYDGWQSLAGTSAGAIAAMARAVRISSGYPYIFAPIEMRDRATGKNGVMVDGGVASSFPVFLFDRPDPRHPTWRFRLHSGLGADQPSSR